MSLLKFCKFGLKQTLNSIQLRFQQVINYYINFSDLELFVLPQTSDRNSAFINLTDWFRNGTNNTSSPDDTIAKYTGFVLKRLSSAKGVVVNIVEGLKLELKLNDNTCYKAILIGSCNYVILTMLIK